MAKTATQSFLDLLEDSMSFGNPNAGLAGGLGGGLAGGPSGGGGANPYASPSSTAATPGEMGDFGGGGTASTSGYGGSVYGGPYQNADFDGSGLRYENVGNAAGGQFQSPGGLTMSIGDAKRAEAILQGVANNYLWENDPRVDPTAYGYMGGVVGQTADGKWLTATGRGPNGEYGGMPSDGTGPIATIARNSVENIDPRLFGQFSQWLGENPGSTFHDLFTPARNNFANHFDQQWILEQYLTDPNVSWGDKVRAVDPIRPEDQTPENMAALGFNFGPSGPAPPPGVNAFNPGSTGLGNTPGTGGTTGPPPPPGTAPPPPPNPYAVAPNPANFGVGGFGGGQGGVKKPGIGPNNQKKINKNK